MRIILDGRVKADKRVTGDNAKIADLRACVDRCLGHNDSSASDASSSRDRGFGADEPRRNKSRLCHNLCEPASDFIVSDRDPGSLGVRIVSVRAEHIGCVGADGIAGKHPRAAFSGS